MTTILALLSALRPGGDVYLSDPRFPRMLRLHKSSLMRTLATMPGDKAILFAVLYPENTAHYSRPRRCVVLREP